MSIVTLIAIITFLIACNTSSSFVSDDEFLDFIQKSHFNYMAPVHVFRALSA